MSLWWHGIEDQLYRTNQSSIGIGNEIKLKMKECFLLIDYEQLPHAKIFNLK